MSAAVEANAGVAPPLVGREQELDQLRVGLTRARSGTGSSWALIGPGGIGKTRILRALEQEATRMGLRVRWGYCLKESLAPFFPFEQIFRSVADRAAPTAAPKLDFPPGATVILEEDKPKLLLERAGALAAGGAPLLLLSRERPVTLRQKNPTLPAEAQLLWLSRTEGPDSIVPGALDALGEKIDTFLQSKKGGVVALSGLEYLISQNAFLPVLRLVQTLRDSAEASGGRLLLSLNTATLEDRQRSLLEAEGEVVREEANPAAPAGAPAGEEPPALRLLRYLELLRAESEEQPLVIVLDDLQWADAQSRTAFEFLARNARDFPVMFVAAMREEADQERSLPGADSLEEVLDHLEQEGLLTQIPLEGLPAGAAQTLVQGLLGVPLTLGPEDRSFLDLVERTEGNPYFLLESLRQLVEQGYLRRDGARAVLSLPGGSGSGAEAGRQGVPLPPTIRRLVSRRLEGLPPEQMRFLSVAAILGSEFELAPVAAALGRRTEELEDWARELESRQRILHPGSKEGTWEFAHPLVWEVLREGIPKVQERDLALALARWWEKERPTGPETLARLYYLARDREGLLRTVPSAIARAMTSRAADAVLRYLRWRQELMSSSPEDLLDRAQFELPLIYRLNLEGSGSVARLLTRELRELTLPVPTRWEVALAHAIISAEVNAGEGRRAALALDQELSGAGPEADPDLRVRVKNAILVALIGESEFDRALAFWTESAPQIGEKVTPRTRSLMGLAHAWCLQALGRPQESLTTLEEAIRQAGPDPPAEDQIRFQNARGAVRFRAGDLVGAGEAFEAAVVLAHRAGNVNQEALYRGNLGNDLFCLGRYDEARKVLEEAIAISEKFQYERGVVQSCRIVGLIDRELGRLPEASAVLRRAKAWYVSTGNPFQALECDLILAGLRSLEGDRLGAVADLDALEPKVHEFSDEELPEFMTTRARWKVAAGDPKGARADLERAGQLQEQYPQNDYFRATLYFERSEVEEAEGHLSPAQQERDRALALFRKVGAVAFRGRRLAELERVKPPSPTAGT